MRNHSEIVAAAGTAEEVALSCGVSIHTVRSWMQRDSIPADIWERFVEAGWSTLDELFAGVKPRKRGSDEPAQAAA